jgi:putative transposase
MNFPLSSFRYRSKKKDDPELIERMKHWAEKKPRYGHPRIHEMIRRDGFKVNHKKTERIYYNLLDLGMRRKKRRKRYRSETRVPIENPIRPNQVWSMDFVSDQLSCGKRIRGLTVLDVFGRYNHGIELYHSLSGKLVVGILEKICSFAGYPEIITVDNGPEFICIAMDRWAYSHGVKLKFSRPGKPTDNPYIESFNGKLRDEFLNSHWFTSLEHARSEAAVWQKEYNEERPHSSLGMFTPEEYLNKYYRKNRLELIV